MPTHGAFCCSFDPDFAGLGAKYPAVIDFLAVLVLPLVNHLMEEGVEDLFPAVAAKVAPTDRDLAGLASGGRRIMAETTLHAA